jgi:DNA-binding CsgD family transcriptional regulator
MENNPLLEHHRNKWYYSDEIDFKVIEPYINSFEKVDELVPPGPRFFIVINLHSYQYEFLGKGQALLSGYDNELVKKEGIKFQMANIHPEDGDFIVNTSYTKYIQILKSYSQEEQKNILLQHNYRFKHKEGHCIHLMEQLWGIKSDDQGRIISCLVQVYQLPMIHPFRMTMLIKKLLPDQSYEQIFSMTHPEQEHTVSLSKREKEIISLLTKGYTSTQIGQKLSISPHTVRTHRKNILQKMEMTSTNELVAYGITNGIV